jgi:hypothetical protein
VVLVGEEVVHVGAEELVMLEQDSQLTQGGLVAHATQPHPNAVLTPTGHQRMVACALVAGAAPTAPPRGAEMLIRIARASPSADVLARRSAASCGIGRGALMETTRPSRSVPQIQIPSAC